MTRSGLRVNPARDFSDCPPDKHSSRSDFLRARSAPVRAYYEQPLSRQAEISFARPAHGSGHGGDALRRARIVRWTRFLVAQMFSTPRPFRLLSSRMHTTAAPRGYCDHLEVHAVNTARAQTAHKMHILSLNAGQGSQRASSRLVCRRREDSSAS